MERLLKRRIYRIAWQRFKNRYNPIPTNNDQEGDGVLTRRQAALANNNTNENTTNSIEDEPNGFQDIETDIPIDNNVNEEILTEETNNSKDVLFNQDTLVASNSDVEAYVVKQYHKRQKIFQ